MGFLSDVVKIGTGGLVDLDTLTGEDAADAAEAAARTQAGSLSEAIEFQRETRDIAREDLAPFREFGAGQIDPLSALLTPEGQADFLRNNPLFQEALESVNRSTLSRQAARGRLGSGETLQDLQTNFLATGLPFIQQQQNALFGALNLGQSSAAGQANIAQSTGLNIADLITQRGDVRASGIVGSQGAEQAALNNLLGLGGSLGSAAIFSGGLSDRRLKENYYKVGEDEYGNIYEFNYKWSPQRFIGRMADELKEILPQAVTVNPFGFMQVSDEFAARAI